MTKYNLLKRIGAGLLATLFVVGLIPPLTAYANSTQNPVTAFEISAATGVGRNYSLSMFWSRPPVGPPTIPPNYPPATPPLPGTYIGSPASWNAHRANSYDVMRFNVNNAANLPLPTGWAAWENIATVTSTSELATHTLPQTLLPGRFYAYQIRARHTRLFWEAVVGQPGVVAQAPRIFESLPNANNALFFMTDLEVQAEGRGRELTVSFTRPQFAGSDPFDAYRIHWQLRAGGTPHSAVFPISALTQVGDTYTITIPDADGLLPSRVFNVWVEPLLGGVDRHAPGIGLPSRPSALSDNFYNAHSVNLQHTTNLFIAENVFINPVLAGYPVGINYLLLYWSPPEAGHVVIQQQGPGGAWFTIALYDSPAAQSIGHLLIDRPMVETNFRIIFHDDTTDEAIYPPEYWTFNPALAQFMPTRPNIVNVDDVPGPPIGLVVTWEAFMRAPFNEEERNSPNMFGDWFRDPDVVYDIWITDNAAAFEGVIPSIPPVIEGLTQEQIQNFQGAPNFTYTHTFNEFIDINGNRLSIVTNRVYYIRIVARRTVPFEQQSVASYASHFIFGDITLPPTVMPRPPLRIENSGLDYLELGWENSWVEAFEVITDTGDPRWPGVWHSAFGLRNGDLVFDYDVVAPNRTTINAGVTALHTLGNETAIRAALDSTQVPLRTQYLPHPQTGYQVHIRVLSEIIDLISYPTGNLENFTNALHNGGGPWVTLTLDVEDITANPLTIFSTLDGLLPDTTYAIFFRPINTAGQAWWPTLIMGTTTSERPDMDITPPAPFLSPYEEGDRWLEFVLRPSPGDAVSYEFWISEFADRSTAWEFEPNEDLSRMFTYPGGAVSGQRRILHVDGLFPETTYYIWVQAISTTNPGNYSWSSSISMTTLPLMTPPPPSGLGLAGPSEVNTINLENDTEFQRVASDHMVISWSPIRGYPGMPDDTNLPMEGNVEGAAGTTILGSPMIGFSYMVLFPDLTPNTAYWVRARTILSVHRDGIGGEITERVDFIVQMATNLNFFDAITVFVMPDADEIQHGMHTRVTMSDWAGPMMFWTTRYDGEFDGDVIPELFPLPDRDFEINFNPYTSTLTWRFRSTDVDEAGHHDNLVDQRFISRLIQLRNFEYTIDMTHYNNQPVENRVVEIPYTILAAFQQRGIDFRVVAGATTYTFSPGFAHTPQNTGFGINSRLRLYISNETEPTSLTPNRNYLTPPQSLDINVVNRVSHTNIPLTVLSTPVTATHSINRALAMDYHIGAYIQSPGDVDWRRGNGGFDEFASTVSTSTTRPTTFAAIGTGIPQLYQVTPQTRDALYFVNTQINFTDMDWFAPSFAIDVWQMNRIIHAVARGVSYAPINMLDNLTDDEMSSLVNAGMLVPGHYTVSREDALAALVRLFEVRTGRRITDAPNLETTNFPDIANASPHLQQALLNAEFLGFLGFDTTSADPHGEMTWGDTMLILEIILRN